jgi:hypothetical protein
MASQSRLECFEGSESEIAPSLFSLPPLVFFLAQRRSRLYLVDTQRPYSNDPPMGVGPRKKISRHHFGLGRPWVRASTTARLKEALETLMPSLRR